MKIKDLPKNELPREKLERYGKEKLADYELLAILLGSGTKGQNVLSLARKIISLRRNTPLQHVTMDMLLTVKGLGHAKAAQIIAAIELGERSIKRQDVEIFSANDVAKLCNDIRNSKREHFVAFYLNSQSELIERQIISIGTLNASLVHPREVFEPALILHAASIIVAHNHPSGKLDPSEQDKEITKRLTEAGMLLGITVVDHLIVTKTDHASIVENTHTYIDF